MVDGRRRSTLDLFDGRLTLLVGRDASVWRAAADRIGGGPPLTVVDIGRDGQRRALAPAEASGHGAPVRTDGGAVLVRPDGHVAWRTASADRPDAQLRAALDRTLGRVPAAARRAA